jgi:hypothetical protein
VGRARRSSDLFAGSKNRPQPRSRSEFIHESALRCFFPLRAMCAERNTCARSARLFIKPGLALIDKVLNIVITLYVFLLLAPTFSFSY